MQRLLIAFCLLTAVALAQGGFDGAGVYQISNIESGKVLDLDRNDQKTVIQFESRRTNNQRWEVRDAGDSGWNLINIMNGYALDQVDERRSTPVACAPFVQGKLSQRWRIERATDGNAVLLSHNGLALDIPDRSRKDGVRVQVFAFNGDRNQRFYFSKVTASGAVIDKRPSLLRSGDNPRNSQGDPPVRPQNPPAAQTQVERAPDASGKYFDTREQTWKFKGDAICLYRERQFRGDAMCVPAGQDMSALGDDWSGKAMSVRFFGKVRDADFFSEPDFRGDRIRIARDNPDLGTSPAARAFSARVY